MGPAFFRVASHVMDNGILVMYDDHRGAGTDTARHVYDFGTGEYPYSMVIYSCINRNGIGHYETVDLFPFNDSARPQHTANDSSDAEPATLFEPRHWLLQHLRDGAARRATDATLDSQRIHVYRRYARLARNVPGQSTTPALQSHGDPNAASNSASTPPSHAADSLSTATRPRRCAGVPARYADTYVHDGMQPSRPRSARRSLLPRLDASVSAAITDHTPQHQPTGHALDTDSPHMSDNPNPAPQPVAAAPRQCASTRLGAVGTRLLANTQAWIRSNKFRGHLARCVHSTAGSSGANQCRSVLQQLAAALQRSPMDEAEVVGHVCVLWMLPAAVFAAPGKMRGGKRARTSRRNRIHQALNDRQLTAKLFAAVVAMDDSDDSLTALPEVGRRLPVTTDNDTQSESDIGSSQPTRADIHSSDASDAVAAYDDDGAGSHDAQRVAQRVESHLAAGHLHRAVQCLSSTSLKANTHSAHERELLSRLHPACPSQLPSCPADAPETVVDLGWMADEMAASDTGAAPGPSGWGSNTLAVLATDTHCVAALALIIQHMLNNNMPPAVRTLLTTSTLVSLVKDDHGGRRPVAVGEMLYRLAARYALFRVLSPAQKALRPHQFGVGEQDGCTQVVQSLQHLLTLPPAPMPRAPARHVFAFSAPRPPPPAIDNTPRPLACLSLDMSNAFNSIDRAALLNAAYANPDLAPCWRMLDFAYGQASLLMMTADSSVADSEAFLLSANGVRQGDPLSSLLFSLAMHTVYSHIASLMRAGCYAYIDDAHAVGYLSQCWTAWQQVPALLQPLGLQLNVAKCELTCFHTATDASVAALHADDQQALNALRVEGVKINTRCLRVLGCVVGATDAVVAAELKSNPKFSADQRAAFRRLPRLKRQTGMIMLRQLTGTVLTNRLRAMTPASTAAHAAEYDQCVLRAAHQLIGINANHADTYDTQLRWPMRIGGFGLTAAVEIAPAAYIAGLASTLPSSPAFAAVWRGDAFGELEHDWPVYSAVQDSINRVAQCEAPLVAQCPANLLALVSKSVMPAQADTFIRHIRAMSSPRLLQSAIAHRISTLSHIATVTQARRRGASGMADLARLNSLDSSKSKESSLWLRVLPTSGHLQLSDHKWRWAAQLRLGMSVPVYAHEDGGTRTCAHTAAANTDGWHPLVCLTASSDAITRRHNLVLNRLAHFARLLHVPTRIEPAGLAADDERRPDIQLDLPAVTLLGDVTISHPLAKSWQRVAAQRGVEAVGDQRQAEKDGLYADMAAECDMDFSAFVLYTYGGFHRSALSFVASMGKAHDPAICLMPLRAWKSQLMEQVAIAVQRGNADIMIQAAQRARGGRWSRRRRHGSKARHTRPSLLTAQQASMGIAHGVGQQRQSSRAVASAARLIGLPRSHDGSPEDDCGDIDSDAETLVAHDTAAHSPSSSSFIPETQMSGHAERAVPAAMHAEEGNSSPANVVVANAVGGEPLRELDGVAVVGRNATEMFLSGVSVRGISVGNAVDCVSVRIDGRECEGWRTGKGRQGMDIGENGLE